MDEEIDSNQHHPKVRLHIEEHASLRELLQQYATTGLTPLLRYWTNTSNILIFVSKTLYSYIMDRGNSPNKDPTELARKFNGLILNPTSRLRTVFNQSELPPPFDLSTVERIHNLTPEQVQLCLQYYGCGDGSTLRDLLEAVGVDPEKLIGKKNKVARNINSVATENQMLRLLMNEEGRYPAQGTMRDGEKVVELSRLQSKNNRILRPLLRFYGLPFDDSSFDHRLKYLLGWLGYPINEQRLANLEVSVNDNTEAIFRLENRMGSLENRMGSLENRMESLENRMESLENRMESLENQMETIVSQLASLQHAVNATNLERDRRTNEAIQALVQARRDGY